MAPPRDEMHRQLQIDLSQAERSELMNRVDLDRAEVTFPLSTSSIQLEKPPIANTRPQG